MIIIPGEPEPKPRPSLLCAGMFAREAERVLANTLKLDLMRRIAELRKSCGVEGPSGTVSVRIPFRYVKDF